MTGQDTRAEEAAAAGDATFELERFAWRSPAHLEVAGRFAGLGTVMPGGPVLVVRGPGGAHQLPVVTDGLVWPPPEGAPWEASFAWEEPPAPFDEADLELGPGLVVGLPEPGHRRPRFGRRTLKVEPTDAVADAETHSQEENVALQPETEETPAIDPLAAPRGIERVRLQADLVAAQEEAREARAAARAAQEELAGARDELARARESLEAERAADAREVESSREGLESVRQAAEEAVAAEREAAERAAEQMRAAQAELEASHGTIDDLHAQLAATEGERTELEGLRRRLDAVRRALDSEG